MGAVLLLISQGASLLAVIPTVMDTAIKIRALFAGSADFTVDIKKFQDTATAANAETLRLIAEWEAAHPPTP